MNEIFLAIVPIVPMRKEPADASEMVSQLLFGEECMLLDKKEQWVKVKGFYDGYIGWVDEKQIAELSVKDNVETAYVSSLFLVAKCNETGENLVLTCGSKLRKLKGKQDVLVVCDLHFQILSGSIILEANWLSVKDVLDVAFSFYNVPYLWGGKSAMGIDCSGFTQIVFKLLGIPIPRDASQQMLVGKEITPLETLQPGDLAFFGKQTDKITHVGILMDSHTIIHASGKIRVDAFNEQGIYNKDLEILTHKLQMTKRIV